MNITKLLKQDTGYTVGRNGKFVKFEFWGVEMVEKNVKASGNSGRIYLPTDWVGSKVKIVKVD